MSIYNLCNKKDLRSMNIFYNSVLGAFEYNNEYVVLIDEKHICILQTEDELQRFIRNINLNIANKCLEKNITCPQISYINENETVEVHALGKIYTTYKINSKDLRIENSTLIPNKRLIKQFYAKAVKNGKKFEALDFSFNELNGALINDVATLVLGINRLTSSQISTFQNYENNFSEIITNFLDYKNKKSKKNFKIDNSLVDSILQIEKDFKELPTLRRPIVLHTQNTNIKNVEENDDISFTNFVSASLTTSNAKGENSVHFILPKGLPFVLMGQISKETDNCGVLFQPSAFQVKSIEKNNQMTDYKLKYLNEEKASKILLTAFRENFEDYVKENSNYKKSRDEFERNQKKYNKFYAANDKQLDIFEEISQIVESEKIEYILEEIEDIDYDKDLFSSEGEYGILHTKRLMLLTAIFSEKAKLSTDEMKILVAAAKYHYLGAKNDKEDENYERKSLDKIGCELDGFNESDKEIVKYIIISHNLKEQESESGSEIKEKLLSYFKDLYELEKIRLYSFNPYNLKNDISKNMIKIAYMNWNVFETLFSYLLTENFAQSRVVDLLAQESSEENAQEKKTFALVRVEEKSTLLSKAIRIFDKLRGIPKDDNLVEESSASAAKARLAKVMVGRKIAKEAIEKENQTNGI